MCEGEKGYVRRWWRVEKIQVRVEERGGDVGESEGEGRSA